MNTQLITCSNCEGEGVGCLISRYSICFVHVLYLRTQLPTSLCYEIGLELYGYVDHVTLLSIMSDVG